MAMSEVLVQVTRGDLVECVHRGSVAVVDVHGRIVFHVGDPWLITYMRSACKPIQAMGLFLSGAAESFGLSDAEIAVTCGSHSGQMEHVEAVRDLLAKAQVPEQELNCGIHAPIDKPTRLALYQRGGDPSEVHCNCSGKHAGMLAICAQMGWGRSGYRFLEHPLQQWLLKQVGVVSDMATEAIHTAPDGCGVTVHGMPISHMAFAFARLASGTGLSEDYRQAAARVVSAMHAHPLLVAGTGRMCTRLNGLPGGRFVAKSGADGVYCIGAVEAGLGIAVKSAEGNGRIAGMVGLEVLNQLGLLTEADQDTLADSLRPENRNLVNDIVGQFTPVFSLVPSSLLGYSMKFG